MLLVLIGSPCMLLPTKHGSSKQASNLILSTMELCPQDSCLRPLTGVFTVAESATRSRARWAVPIGNVGKRIRLGLLGSFSADLG